ncbi:alpha/beta hydrolase, partial [Streptomyces sp. NPDC006386]
MYTRRTPRTASAPTASASTASAPRSGGLHRRARSGARTAAGLLATAALLVSACSSGSSTTATASAASAASAAAVAAVLVALPRPVPAALSPYYRQKPAWRGCGVPGFECATVKAPLDYDKPSGGDVRLAVARKKATGPGARLGSLLVNPGGPGGSAIGYVQAYAGIGYPSEVRARYDMVAV